MANVMQTLRLETREPHVRLERTVDLKSRFQSLTGYVDLLQKMLGLHEPLEAALQRLDWSRTGLDPRQRQKTGWIKADLLSLGRTDQEIVGLPECMQLPALDNLARGIGCLYVLEGSTLGGSVIARQLTRVLGIGPDTGGRFYASYGERLGDMWAAFGVAANDCCDTDAARDQALGAARETFECFDYWFRSSQSGETVAAAALIRGVDGVVAQRVHPSHG